MAFLIDKSINEPLTREEILLERKPFPLECPGKLKQQVRDAGRLGRGRPAAVRPTSQPAPLFGVEVVALEEEAGRKLALEREIGKPQGSFADLRRLPRSDPPGHEAG